MDDAKTGHACVSPQKDIASCFSSSSGSSNSTSNSNTSEGNDKCSAKTNHPSFIEIPLTMEDNNNNNNNEGRKKRPHSEEEDDKDTQSANKRPNNGLSQLMMRFQRCWYLNLQQGQKRNLRKPQELWKDNQLLQRINQLL